MADFLLALADFDRKRLWSELGHTSLFYYLHRELKLSKGAAQNRKTAAELIQAFPEVEAALRGGELCLSTVNELAKVLTPENRADVLPRFFGLSRREAEAVAASLRPAEVVPTRDVVTAIPPAAPALRAATAQAALPAASPESAMLRAHPDEPQPIVVHLDEPSGGCPCDPARSAATPRVRGSARRRARPRARHRLPPLPREARGCEGRARACLPRRQRSGDPRARSRSRPRPAREAPGPRREASEGPPGVAQRHDPCRGEAGGVAPCRGAVRMEVRVRRALRLPAAPRVRSHRARRGGRCVHHRQRPARLSPPQSPLGPAGLRGCGDGPLYAPAVFGTAGAEPAAPCDRPGEIGRWFHAPASPPGIIRVTGALLFRAL